MNQEKRVRINPSLIESDMIDTFQDTLVSRSLAIIKNVLEPLQGIELDPNKGYVEEIHSVAFTEQYTLTELEALGQSWQEARNEQKTSLDGKAIAGILAQAKLLREQSGLEPAHTDRVAISCGYELENPFFEGIFHRARMAGALTNFLHSLFLPNSKYRKMFVPSNAEPFFMLASLVESRSYTVKKNEAVKREEAETVWNLLLTTPIGSRLLCISRTGLTTDLTVSLMGNSIEGEDALGDPTKSSLLMDPKKDYKKFSDGETPLHPAFYPIFNKNANAKPDGPMAFVFNTEKSSSAYNVSLDQLQLRTQEIWSMDADKATARVIEIIKKGEKLRSGGAEPPKHPDFIFDSVKNDLQYYKTPEVLMETLMGHAFVPRPPDLIDRISNHTITPLERAHLMRIALGGDYLLGILVECGAVRKE
ncbi:hypothetical protein CL689_02830 [Candidatus Saccharibacteria bacterium]|nr:hypothetical protein [Candidatus Saccharibacteria bacterium]|tara:strand:+ start:813 stop:2072 length:1260 start_codon:yes stop_codon:yes gene_type:complete